MFWRNTINDKIHELLWKRFEKQNTKKTKYNNFVNNIGTTRNHQSWLLSRQHLDKDRRRRSAVQWIEHFLQASKRQKISLSNHKKKKHFYPMEISVASFFIFLFDKTEIWTSLTFAFSGNDGDSDTCIVMSTKRCGYWRWIVTTSTSNTMLSIKYIFDRSHKAENIQSTKTRVSIPHFFDGECNGDASR